MSWPAPPTSARPASGSTSRPAPPRSSLGRLGTTPGPTMTIAGWPKRCCPPSADRSELRPGREVSVLLSDPVHPRSGGAEVPRPALVAECRLGGEQGGQLEHPVEGHLRPLQCFVGQRQQMVGDL